MNPYLEQIKKELVGTTVPMVSVIVPLYNYQEYVLETIESVVKQTYKDWELIIVDDCSTDDSYNIVKEYVHSHPQYPICLWQNERNSGISATRNVGLKKAKGKYILLLDADDKIAEKALEKYISAIEREDADICYSQTQLFGTEDGIWELPPANCFKYNPWGCSINPTCLFKKAILEKVGGFAEDMRADEDWQFWASFVIKGVTKYTKIDEPLFLYRKHGNSLTQLGKTDHTLRAKLVLHNKEFYNKYYVMWAKGILADEPDCISLINEFHHLLPDFLTLLGYFERENWDYIKQELNEKFLPMVASGCILTPIPVNMPDGSTIELEYLPHHTLTIGHKAKASNSINSAL
ncbi:MAG: glycosyltransferase [Ignavibacteria bacterium]|jgi:glycosyltransferase involved in cell wall biosynthesis|nr:glycosyltransferase [Ignavibacteria bacterium]